MDWPNSKLYFRRYLQQRLEDIYDVIDETFQSTNSPTTHLVSIDNRQANVVQSLILIAVREVYLLAGPYDGAPRPCVIHSARSGPAEGGRPTPPTSSGTGVARLVSRFTLKLQVGSRVDSKRKYTL